MSAGRPKSCSYHGRTASRFVMATPAKRTWASIPDGGYTITAPSLGARLVQTSGVAAPLAQRGPVLGVPAVVGGAQAVAGPPLGRELLRGATGPPAGAGGRRPRARSLGPTRRVLPAPRQRAPREGLPLRRTKRRHPTVARPVHPDRQGAPPCARGPCPGRRARRPRRWPAASTPLAQLGQARRRRGFAGGHHAPRPCFRSWSPRRPPSHRRRDPSARSGLRDWRIWRATRCPASR